MNGIARYLIYTLLLFLVETVVSTGLLMLFAAGHFVRGLYNADVAFLDGTTVNFTRLFTYYPITVIGFATLMVTVHWRWRTLQAAIINCSLYVLLSLIYGLAIALTRSFFLNGTFLSLITATFISPYLLHPLGRKLKITATK